MDLSQRTSRHPCCPPRHQPQWSLPPWFLLHRDQPGGSDSDAAQRLAVVASMAAALPSIWGRLKR